MEAFDRHDGIDATVRSEAGWERQRHPGENADNTTLKPLNGKSGNGP